MFLRSIIFKVISSFPGDFRSVRCLQNSSIPDSALRILKRVSKAHRPASWSCIFYVIPQTVYVNLTAKPRTIKMLLICVPSYDVFITQRRNS
jgi:hypothetical protein